MISRMIWRAGVILTSLLVTRSSAQPEFAGLRRLMVREQIAARGITTASVLRALGKVERHLFVPDVYQDRAYEDTPLPIGYGQTISQPYVVALMTDLLRLQPGDKVLDIGTGSGYQAAVLAEIVDQVYSIEIVPELGKLARERLQNLGYENIQVRIGDGYYGWPEAAPFDGILIAATVDSVPPVLIEQLKSGGRMIVPVGPDPARAKLVLIQKKGDRIMKREVTPVRFVPFVRPSTEGK